MIGLGRGTACINNKTKCQVFRVIVELDEIDAQVDSYHSRSIWVRREELLDVV